MSEKQQKMKLYFWGAGSFGSYALEKYDCYKDGNSIFCGFIDTVKKGTYQGFPIYKIDEIENRDSIIVITIDDWRKVCELYIQLKKAGYHNLYWFVNYEIRNLEDDFLTSSCIDCKEWGDCVLTYVEMHIADHCNLNCKGCTHYAPIFEKSFVDFSITIDSVKKLKDKVSHIMVLSILGGEPLLNPELPLFIEKLREMLPDTRIQIVTNGLLIPSIDTSILECIRKNNVIVRISEYKPTLKIRHRIEARLREYKITYMIQPYEIKQKFIKPLSLSENSIYPQKCISDGCVNIWNGRIARCPSLMFIEKFNEVFSVDLPAEGIMNLNDCPSGKELLDKLNEAVPLCKHCVSNEIEWEQCGVKPQLEDFVTAE